MSRSALLASAAGIALAGFIAGTALHPIARISRPHFGGRTLAPDSASATARAFRRCDGLGWTPKMKCYDEELQPIAAQRGPKAALAVLAALSAMDHDLKTREHDAAHAIGVAAFDAQQSVTLTFPECGVEFQSGCYHGVIQAYFIHAGTDDSVTVRALCSPWMQEGVYGWLRFQCAHGLGHGLTMLLDHDLPDALKKCDYLPDDWDRESCYGGAFMENIVDTTQPKHEMTMPHMVMHDPARPKFKQLDEKDPAYPCSILADRYQVSCWTNQASIIEYIAAYDVAKTAAGCDLAPERYVRWCYIGLGTDLNGRALSDPKAGLAFCDLTGTRRREWCYVGVAKNLVEVGAEPEKGMAFCRLVTGSAWKLRCYEAVGEEIASLAAARPEREKMCLAAEEKYRQACRFGARVIAAIPPGLTPSA